MTKTAVVIGVGPIEGLGAYLSLHAAREDLHVVVAGRTSANLELVVERIVSDGGSASACVTDATIESDVVDLLDSAEQIGPVDLAIYNAGNNYSGDFLTMQADYFERAWRVCTLGGFLSARGAVQAMLQRSVGTLLFTGASASMRGRPNFSAFTAAKAGLRALAQSMAKELMPQNIHVAHVIIDGPIDTEWTRQRFPEMVKERPVDGLLQPDDIADTYWAIHNQKRSAWTFETDVRPWVEPW